MARSISRREPAQVPVEKNYFTFVAGLNTDASPLTFPDNFSADEENFDLNLDGSRERRYGLDIEAGGSSTGVPAYIRTSTPTPTVIDLGGGERGWNFTAISGAYPGRITYDPATSTLELRTVTLEGELITSILIGTTTYIVAAAAYSTGGSWTYRTWSSVTSFPALAATPAFEVFGYTNGAVRCHHWRNVGGNPDHNQLVIQSGTYLTFLTDSPTIGATVLARIDLLDHAAPGATVSQIADSLVNTDYGRGHLFVAGKYIQPFYVEWVTSTSSISVYTVDLKERDFEGIEDGYSDIAQPISAVASHTYNLYNKGWGSALVTAFASAQSKQPAKNMIPWRGFRRETTSGVAEADWTKAFSPAKLVSELWQDVPAPSGHFTRDPFDTTKVFGSVSTQLAVASWEIDAAGPGGVLEITTSGNHSWTVGNVVTVTGISVLVEGGFDGGNYLHSLDGSYTVLAGPGANTFEADVNTPLLTMELSDTNEGTVTGQYLNNISGYTSSVRPSAVAFFAGRAWFAGTEHPKISHKVFFSQVVENDAQYGKCYQVADPTSEHISDLIATDGGVIVIPEMDTVQEIIQHSGRLLIFADNGVWEISGGESGYFSAVGYAVRQISSIGCVAPASVIVAEGVPFFWGEGAIYAITQDENSGYLTAQDLTTGRIQKLLLDLSKEQKASVQVAFDRNTKKLYWLYDSASALDGSFKSWLILDLRINAFSKHKNYSAYKIRGIYDIEDYQASASATRNIKFLCFSSNNQTMYIGEANATDYQDFGTDAPAFCVTGYESHIKEGADAARRRYGTWLYTYMKRTETGYTLVADEWVPTNPGGCHVRFLWNWTDRDNTGKWSSSQQVYKYQRPWIPANATDLIGDSVIVTRSKIRGTGKTLQLRFDTEAGKDCHLLGWHVRMKINREM